MVWRSVLEYACQRGWARLASYVLPYLTDSLPNFPEYLATLLCGPAKDVGLDTPLLSVALARGHINLLQVCSCTLLCTRSCSVTTLCLSICLAIKKALSNDYCVCQNCVEGCQGPGTSFVLW